MKRRAYISLLSILFIPIMFISYGYAPLRVLNGEDVLSVQNIRQSLMRGDSSVVVFYQQSGKEDSSDSTEGYCRFIYESYHPDSLHLGQWSVAQKDTSKLAVELRTQQLYDTIKVLSTRNKFWNFVHGLIVVTPSDSKLQVNDVVDEKTLYNKYDGKTIAGIEFERQPVFYPSRGYLEAWANKVHIVTAEFTIRRDLLFKVGQKFNADVIVRNKQLLRSRQYIADANIVVTPVEGDASAVIIKVITRDSWTISADGSMSTSTWEARGSIYDANFLGTGDRLTYQLSLDFKKGNYGGSMIRYNSPNFLGFFWEAGATMGRSFRENYYGAWVDKKFLQPTDYVLGALYEDVRSEMYVRYQNQDNTINGHYNVSYTNIDLLAGGSWFRPRMKSSFYVMGRFRNLHYRDTPKLVERELENGSLHELPIKDGVNPYFYNQSSLLASFGFYRENFLTAKLIYGYGYDEYIATGYKAELTLGYLDAQYRPGYYMGAAFRMGRFTQAGYFMGDLSVGSFYNAPRQALFRSTLDVKLNYFTNLLGQRRFKFRQFASINWLNGWNRMDGFYESIWFNRESGPRELKESPLGHNRMVIATESVLFTPWQPMGFSTALFVFVDVGLLGYDRNVFRNTCYSSVGIGIRMKNERLVFGTIQLSLFASFGKQGFLKTDWMNLTNEKRLQTPRYIPGRPDFVGYR